MSEFQQGVVVGLAIVSAVLSAVNFVFLCIVVGRLNKNDP